MTHKDCLDLLQNGNHREVISFLREWGAEAKCLDTLEELDIVEDFYEENEIKFEGNELISHRERIFGSDLRSNPVRHLIEYLDEFFSWY